MTVQIISKPPSKFGLSTLIGSLDLEHGVQGDELNTQLIEAQDAFVRAMELRGYTLYKNPKLQNPVWQVWGDGTPKAVFAPDWTGERKTGKRVGPDGLPLPTRRETSLEDSEGMVEYRVAGVFWTPQKAVEILTTEEDIREEARLGRNPLQWGYGGQSRKEADNG